MTGRAVVHQAASGVRLEIRTIPRSTRASVDGMRGDRLVVRVTAAPVDQAANDAVVALLAEILDVPKSAVHIVSGATSRNKSVVIERVDAAAVRAKLGL